MTDRPSGRLAAGSAAGPAEDDGELVRPQRPQLRKFMPMVRKLCGSKAAEMYRLGFLDEEIRDIIRLNGTGVERMPSPDLTAMMQRLRKRFVDDPNFLAVLQAPEDLPEVPHGSPVEVSEEKLKRYSDLMGYTTYDLLVQLWPGMSLKQQQDFFQDVLERALIVDGYPKAIEKQHLLKHLSLAFRLEMKPAPENLQRIIFFRIGDVDRTVLYVARGPRRATNRLSDLAAESKRIKADLARMTVNGDDDFDLLEGGSVRTDSSDDSSAVNLVDSATKAFLRRDAASPPASAGGTRVDPVLNDRLTSTGPTVPAPAVDPLADTRRKQRAPRGVPLPTPVPAPPAPAAMPKPGDSGPMRVTDLPQGHVSGDDIRALHLHPVSPSPPPPRSKWRYLVWLVLGLTLLLTTAYVLVDIFVGPAKPRFAGLANDPTSLAALTSVVTPDPSVQEGLVPPAQVWPLLLRDNKIVRVGDDWVCRIYVRNTSDRALIMPDDLGIISFRVTYQPGATDLELVDLRSAFDANGHVTVQLLFVSGRRSESDRPLSPSELRYDFIIR